ncbi:MAG: methyltransferase domain-containing protein [Verrucomicrobiales bacterium]|nr:methyltransferase domain-containing protein [Verrucomicrobiales bacterium]
MKCQVHTRSICRLCGGSRLREFLRFPSMPFTDEFVAPDAAGTEFVADIPVFWCADCRSAQTQHDVEVGHYYRDYRYTVSASPFARRFMARLAEEVFRRFRLQPGDRVLEIGSGDGHQLDCFRKQGAEVLGFEPSAELCRVAGDAGIPTIQTLFDCRGVEQIPAASRPAQVVLLTYTFDHLPEPAPFLELVRSVLDPRRGLLVIEVHDLAKIVQRREICLFEHEHSIYLTGLSLQRLLAASGFRLLTTKLLRESERRGNSLLVVATPDSSDVRDSDFSPDPEDLALETWERLERFGADVRAGVARFRNYLLERTAKGVRFAGYGAGGRGVMTLAMAGITRKEIAYLCDQNAGFYGRLTPATHIPVVAPEHVFVQPVDELIVFSYAYLEEIRERLRHFVESGGRLTSFLDLI